jgi:long-chain acyl-CoA synthetase
LAALRGRAILSKRIFPYRIHLFSLWLVWLAYDQQYIGVVNHPDLARYDWTPVRACISGAAPLPMEVQERFGQITGGRLVEGYGLTEASPITHCNPVYGVCKAGSTGAPVPNVEARVVDLETGEMLQPGSTRTGELQVRGPQV